MSSHGVTPTALIERTGFSRKHLIQIRKGESVPGLHTAVAITEALCDLTGERVVLEQLFDVQQRRKAS